MAARPCPVRRPGTCGHLHRLFDEGMTMTTMTDATTRVTAGVDTHRDQHVVAALDERGGELGVRSFATTTAGYRQALAWLRSLGPVERIGVEGTGTYGRWPDPLPARRGGGGGGGESPQPPAATPPR